MVLLLFLGFPQEGRTQESPDDVSGQPRPWLFGSAATFSQPIFTDRPTFSLGPSTMPQGRVQMETGYTFSFENAHPNIRTHTVPEALWRFGLVEKIELRLEWPTVTVVNNGKSSHGLRDLAVGVKAEVFPQAGLLPQLSLAGRLSIPTGDKAFSSDRLDPEFRTILAYAMNERIGLFGNVGLAVPTSQHTRFVQVFSSFGLSAVARKNLTGFVEYFGLYPREVAGGSGHFLQTGFLYFISPHLQLDIRVGAGLTHGTDDFITGTGISWRF